MKFLIVESCLLRGDHLEAGTVADLSAADAFTLNQAGRGYGVPDDYRSPAEIKAEAEAKAAAEAEAAALAAAKEAKEKAKAEAAAAKKK